MPLSRSALAYRKNPDSAKKHAEYNTKRNKSKERTAYRVELNRERRKRGIYGKGGPDMSHTESGNLVAEGSSKNRGRNGARGESTKRKDFVEGKGKKCGRGYIPATDKCTKGNGVRTAAKVALGAGLVAGAVALAKGRVRKTTPYIKTTPRITGSSPTALLLPAAKPKVHKVKAAPNLKLHRELESKLKTRFFSRMENYNDFITKRAYNDKHKYVLVEFLDNNYGVASTDKGQIEFMAFAGRDKEGKVYTKDINFTTEGSYSPIKDKVTPKDTIEVFSKVERMLQKAIENDPDDLIVTTSPISPGLEKIYTKYGFKEDDTGGHLTTTVGELKKRSRRNDALRARKGKKCGQSYIPRSHKCGPNTPSSGITPQKAAILGAGVALGALAAIQTRSLWTPALGRLYTEARSKNIPWNTYARKQKADLLDPQVRRLSLARQKFAQRVCSSRGDSRLDAWSACQFAVGEPSSYGRVIKHPNQPIVFKVPKEIHYIATGKGSSKKLRSRTAQMFEEEASNLQLANRLGVDSPKLHGYNSNKNVIAMEFLDGYDTYRNLRGQSKALDTLVNFQVFSNTRRMHTQGMVHRDLHAGNILVNPITKKIAIIDFGHAKRKRNLDTEQFQRAVADEIQVLTDMTLNLTDSQAGKIIDARNRHMTFNHAPDSSFNYAQLQQYEAGVNKQREDFYSELSTILLSF